MTESSDWVPEGVDVTRPHAARVYDAALGGVHNFAVDREFVRRAEQAFSGIVPLARANRHFLSEAVRRLTRAGIRQFLDLGSGMPTAGNVHEVAQAEAPGARVVYVDHDPVAVSQSRGLLGGNPDARVIEADLRDPRAILNHPEVTGLLDFAEPIGVLTVAVLHFIPDEADPGGILATVGAALAPGSLLALSHLGPGPTAEARAASDRLTRLYEGTPTPVTERTAEQVAALLTPTFELVAPGVVAASEWYADSPWPADPRSPAILVAVARKP